MKEIYSKIEDVKYLAYELKKILGDQISINYYSLGQEVLTGKIFLGANHNNFLNNLDFNIKYNQDNFLRINVGEIYLVSSYIKKEQALKILVEAIGNIKRGCNDYIGTPDAFYQIEHDGFRVPYYEWAFTNKNEYLTELKNNTLFDDAEVLNLEIIPKEEKTLSKIKENISL